MIGSFGSPVAKSVPYDNATTPGLSATNLQDAVVQVVGLIPGGGITDAVGMTKIPDGTTAQIAENYESVITRRVFVLGRLLLVGRLSVLF